jgi:hypothetical protein
VARAAVAVVIVAGLAVAAAVRPGHSGHATAAAPRLAPTPRAAVRPGTGAGWVARENQRPGTTAWRISQIGAPGAIEGWADHASAASGDRMRLFVSTTAPRFRIEAYRMGWYGGLGARLVWRSALLPGHQQPPPARTPGTNTVATH